MNMREYFESHPNLKYIIFGGKGGLGKTTLSATTSFWLAKRGKRVVVFSTDPQASLTDIFERNIFGKGEVEIAPNLYALEIDADRRIAEYQEEIRRKIIERYGEVPPEINDYIESAAAEPAMAESATFDAMVELMTSGKFDMYIFDMMPHGHAIRFLGMGQLLDAWIDKVVETRKKAAEYGDVAAVMSGKGSLAQEDEILNELEFIRSRLDFVSKIMRDTEHTAFFYVLIPEEMAILDTQKAIKMFGEFGIPISGVIVNQVYPVELLDDPSTPEFLRNRIMMQQEHMKRIKELFGDLILGVVPMLDREPKGLEMLEKLAKILYGG
ncbi:arsenic transporter [Candidatus Korarchaeum cryptofilum]|jgi:arsenite-transporting ATPase|uniref:Arsenic transporter n=1 Tax=Candidatus Korarchaeum cryptofilum TaxID=498846 RepID=A0A3R9QPY6_9CREN|nr:TRC40/GET3/ArsA family transport-energizing ATPase [Candidatus Korarchaeum cryptofilum]RSN67649.1 arsenic transporter [Candidatus Korarchaeum cryptofilum]